MKPLVWILVVALLSLSITACSGADKDGGPVSHGSSGPSATTYNAAAVKSVLDFGHAADPVDKQAVTTLVKHYYHAAAAEDGATACSLILSNLANSVPEDYGQAPGPSYMRGKTCPAVMSRLFMHFHQRMASDFASLEVTRVRLKTRGGYAVLRFNEMPIREINVVRQGSTWKLSSLLDSNPSL
jgi:hypothetical protein